MLNLLVSHDASLWESNTAVFPRDRCLTEYIMEDLCSRFSSLGDNEIKQLIKLPTIFAYEQYNRKDALIGKITNITVRQQNVKIDFKLTGDKISFDDFKKIEPLLDIGQWEMNRTHWTVKKIKMADIEPYFINKTIKKPKVFISYSWTPPENKINVSKLIEKLLADNITVIYDKKDLQPGQDKNYFMEQALTDRKIDKVLVICNRDYAKKADERKDGVGHESEIIISQISSKPMQTKYIPVVMETDKNDKACLPRFLASRKYIDLTKESGYDELVNAIRTNDNKGMNNV